MYLVYMINKVFIYLYVLENHGNAITGNTWLTGKHNKYELKTISRN
jgi:hypothetical protein